MGLLFLTSSPLWNAHFTLLNTTLYCAKWVRDFPPSTVDFGRVQFDGVDSLALLPIPMGVHIVSIPFHRSR
jgi:hypothetical protein